MVTMLASIPIIVGRSFLAPLNVLPSRFSNTELIFPEETNYASSSTSAASTSSHSQEHPRCFTSVPLRHLIAETPSIRSYYPHPLLPLGSVQTMYSAIADTVAVDEVHFKRHVLLLPDGGTIAVDVSPPEWDEAESEQGQKRQTVLLNHGLTGGSHESYVRHVIPPLVASGYRCVVVNFRGCGQTPVSSPQMYSAGKTDDLRCGLLWTLKRWKQTEIVLMGFSLGANVVAKYLGEAGDDTPVKGGIVLATPFDLKIGSDCLAKSALYDGVMSSNLTNKIGVHAGTLALDPTLREPLKRLLDPKSVDKEYIKSRGAGVKPKTLKWVDDTMTRLAGGHSGPYGEFPFDSADHYYNANGSIHKLGNVARPLLLLNSDDDPIVPRPILDKTKEAIQGNPNIVLGITRGGGHLGWWTTSKGRMLGKPKPRRWLGKVANEWVQQVFQASAAESEYQQRTDPWKDGDVEEVQVEYELLSEEEVLPFDIKTFEAKGSEDGNQKQAVDDAVKKIPDELKKPTSSSTQTTPSSEASASTSSPPPPLEGPPRQAWLKTHLLKSYPLLHPLSHPNHSGVLLHPDQKEGPLSGIMYQSKSLPQVGFLELKEESRVAGCGLIFQGGKDIPGQSTDTKGNKKVVEKGGKKGLFGLGMVGGL